VKLSSKGRYAIRALFDIAYYNEGRPTQVKDIADRQGIPPRFLEQIFQDLKRAGIVGSKRGPQGGYLLKRTPEEVSLGEVIQVIEGPVALGESSQAGAGRTKRAASLDGQKVTDAVFSELSKAIATCLDEVTIKDVCDKAGEMGISLQSGTDGYMYFI
jgi:Rrf2 family protein